MCWGSDAVAALSSRLIARRGLDRRNGPPTISEPAHCKSSRSKCSMRRMKLMRQQREQQELHSSVKLLQGHAPVVCAFSSIAAVDRGVANVTGRRNIRTRVIAMDSTAAEFGAVGRVDVAAPLYAVDFDISIPLLLQCRSCDKRQRVAFPVEKHRLAGKGGIG